MGKAARKRQRRKHQKWYQTAEAIRPLLQSKGLDLRVTVPDMGKRGAPHWMIEKEGKRVLDYWPTTGRWWCHTFGQSGSVLAPIDVVAVACQMEQEQP